MLILVIVAAGAYLFGSIPTANILARVFRGVDLRDFGSGAVTSSNVGVLMGWKVTVVAGVLDALKGAAVVWVAQALDRSLADQMIIGIMAVTGHNWSVFLKFQGGRGLATMFGVVLATAPWLLALLGVFVLLGLVIFKNAPIVLGLGSALLPLWAYSLDDDRSIIWGAGVLAAIVLVKRLAGNRLGELPREGRGRVFLYRLLYDRDVKEREEWIHRPTPGSSPEGPVQPPA